MREFKRNSQAIKNKIHELIASVSVVDAGANSATNNEAQLAMEKKARKELRMINVTKKSNDLTRKIVTF